MRGRLFLRYWVVISALITAFLVIGGAVEILIAYRENTGRIAGVQRAEARLVASRINQSLEPIERLLKDVASRPWHPGLLEREGMRPEFDRLLNIDPAIHELRAFRPDGTLAVAEVREDAAVGSRAAYRPERGPASNPVYHPVEYRNDSEPFVGVSLWIEGPPGHFGRIEAHLNLKFVSDVIGNAPGGGGRSAYVIDASDNLIAHSDTNYRLQRLNLASMEHVVGARRATAVTGDGTWGVRAKSLDGVEVVASSAPVGKARWIAFVEEPAEHAQRDALATVRRTTVLIVAGLLAALFASSLLAQRLSRPIVDMRAKARRIASGDSQARLEIKTGDELEALAEEFNDMASQLQEYAAGLERKVAEKTAELQAADVHKTGLLLRVEKERAAAEQALQVAREAMRAKALFLAAASHDLRQPLYAISLLAESQSLQHVSEQGSAVLGKLRRAIGILRALLDNMLDLSRFDAGEIRPVLRDVSLRELLAPVTAEHEVLSQAKGLAWNARIEDLWVRTDPELARRLVGNLLSNAVRYTSTGGVSLVAERAGTRVIVRVVDTGCGIPKEEQGRVFQEFVQLANAGRDRDKGVGLGLSIVKRIALLLDAQLEFESTQGAGTTFRVEFPLGATEVPAREDVPSDPASFGVEGLRLWIVEDDELVREALGLLFEDLAVRCDFAASRAELTELRDAQGAWPDAAMLDDSLGNGEHGLELAAWLREHLHPDRIVIVTGNVDPRRVRAIEESGFLLFRKPLAAVDLRRWLARVGSLERRP